MWADNILQVRSEDGQFLDDFRSPEDGGGELGLGFGLAEQLDC